MTGDGRLTGVWLTDREDVTAVADELGFPLAPGATRRTLVTNSVELPGLVNGWFAVREAPLLGVKKCPPCPHVGRLAGIERIEAMRNRVGQAHPDERGGTDERPDQGGPLQHLKAMCRMLECQPGDLLEWVGGQRTRRMGPLMIGAF